MDGEQLRVPKALPARLRVPRNILAFIPLKKAPGSQVV